MADKMCTEHGLTLTETSIGFKYLCAELLKGDVLMAGEEGSLGFPATFRSATEFSPA